MCRGHAIDTVTVRIPPLEEALIVVRWIRVRYYVTVVTQEEIPQL